MPRKNPESASQVISNDRKRVRRRYKVDLSKRKKYAPGEENFLVDTAIVLTVSGYSRNQIAKLIGVSKLQVKELLEAPDVADRITSLRQRLPQAAIDLLQGLMAEAVIAIADVMRTSKRDEMILKAAAEILDRGGAAKASRTETNVHQVNEQRTTFSDGGMAEMLRQLPPEMQEEAAQMFEKLEDFMNAATSKPATKGEE